MKTIACFFALASALFAQESPKTNIASALEAAAGSKSIIVIDPKARAADFAQAFDFLRKDKPSQKIMVNTINGNLLNVVDVTPSTGGTLLMVKVLSNQGGRTEMVPVEQVMDIGYSP